MPSKNDELVNWGVDDHPSVELLRQHEEGTLPEDLNYKLERHLLDCELCTDVVEGMSLTEPARTRSNVYKISQRIKNRLRKQRKKSFIHGLGDWRVVTAIAMLFCLMLLLILYLYLRSMPSQQTPAPEPVQQEQNTPIQQ